MVFFPGYPMNVFYLQLNRAACCLSLSFFFLCLHVTFLCVHVYSGLIVHFFHPVAGCLSSVCTKVHLKCMMSHVRC